MINKPFFLIFLLTTLALTSSCKRSEKPLLLESGWHFRLGDKMDWAARDFDENKWDTISLGHLYSGKMFENYLGYAWFRLRFNLTKDILRNKTSINSDSILLYLGAIDDCDEVYLNGLLVGSNNKNLPKGAKSDPGFIKIKDLWNVPRQYTLPINDPRLKWGEENVIAIRVFSPYGRGGIYAEVPRVRAYGLTDYFFVDLNEFYKVNDNGYVNREITFRNKSPVLPVRGNWHITATNMETKKEVLNIGSFLELKPGEVSPLFIKLPISTDSIGIAISLNELNSEQTITLHDSIPYVLTP